MTVETAFKNIADAIRTRSGTSGIITPAAMPQSILDIPGGGDYIAAWDFTQSLVDNIQGVQASLSGVATQSTNGIEIGTTGRITVPYFMACSRIFEIEIGDMELIGSSNHHRFFMLDIEQGLIYRNTGRWSFYRGSWAVDSNISDYNFFANSKMTVEIEANGQWNIYKNDVLVYTPSLKTVSPISYNLFIGSNSASANQSVIRSLKIK